MRHWIVLSLFVVCLATTTGAFAQKECNGPFKGEKPTHEQLAEVLANHQEWVDAGYPDGDGRRANLCGANLTKANLSGANLIVANLRVADLSVADLSGANLTGADLIGADLIGADVFEADLIAANLSGADLSGANLSGANLSGANLSRARLNDANLEGAKLSSARLTDAIFEPSTAPSKGHLSNLKGVATVTFNVGKHSGLVQLRNALQEAGLRRLEREATFALKNQQTAHRLAGEYGVLGRVDGAFNWLLFEVTTAWGMDPGRAVLLLAGFIVVLTPAYRKALVKPNKDGIWRVWSEERRRQDLGQGEGDRPLELRGVKAWRTALYFSVLSAFHVGWRDLNVGNWIARIQRYEYTLRATGWARTVSGAQSLLSVYLLAIWALTYFGRPFQ